MTGRASVALAAAVVGLAGVLLGGAGGFAAEPPSPSHQLRFFGSKEAGDAQPLILFLDGGPDAGDPAEGSEIARALAQHGVNVALIEPPEPRGDRHAAGRMLASAVALAAKSSARLGSDPRRIYCLGRGWGAEVVASVVLDPSYLSAVGHDRSAIAGAMTLNADLTALLPLADRLKDEERPGAGAGVAVSASLPMREEVRVPRLLFITQHGGPRDFAISARRLANALRGAAVPFANDVIDPHYQAPIPWGSRDISLHLLLQFVGAKPLLQTISDRLLVEYRAKAVPISDNEQIWEGGAKVEAHPIDAEFIASLELVFAERLELLDAFPLQRYQAVDLLDYLASLPEEVVGKGDHLVVTSIRGETLYLTREQLEQTRPRLVIGIDDERNLFRLAIGYLGPRDYSWIDDAGRPRPWLVRPVGAFLHVPGERRGTVLTTTRFGLNAASFRWVADDPLAPMADLSPKVRATMAAATCMQCHAFRGIGGGGHHLGAFTRTTEAGIALPLEDYPSHVMEQFLFDQESVAAMMGTVPVPMDQEMISVLHSVISQEARNARMRQ